MVAGSGFEYQPHDYTDGKHGNGADKKEDCLNVKTAFDGSYNFYGERPDAER